MCHALLKKAILLHKMAIVCSHLSMAVYTEKNRTQSIPFICDIFITMTTKIIIVCSILLFVAFIYLISSVFDQVILRISVEKSFTTLESKIPTNISEDYLIEQLEDSNTEVSVTSGMSSGMTSVRH